MPAARPLLLVIDHFPEAYIQELATLPVDLHYLYPASDEALADLLPQAEMLVLNSRISLNAATIPPHFPLQIAIRAGVGMDHIDEPYMAEIGVAVHKTAGANADAVGEQTVGMLLSLLTHLHKTDREVKQFAWIREANRGTELGSLTVGLIGYGHTGQATARKLNGFDCRVLAYDKYRIDYGDEFAEAVDLETIFEKAQVCSFHVPLTDETHLWGNSDFFEKFRHPIYLMNLARGPIVELEALLQALDAGQVLGAGLDVLENEQFDRLSLEQRQRYERLFARDNVVLSPHIGGWTFQSQKNIQDRILQILTTYLAQR